MPTRTFSLVSIKLSPGFVLILCFFRFCLLFVCLFFLLVAVCKSSLSFVFVSCFSGGQGSPKTLFPTLLLLLSCVPQDVTGEAQQAVSFYRGFVAPIWAALKPSKASTLDTEADAVRIVVDSFLECSLFAIVTTIKRKQFAVAVQLLADFFEHLRACLTFLYVLAPSAPASVEAPSIPPLDSWTLEQLAPVYLVQVVAPRIAQLERHLLTLQCSLAVTNASTDDTHKLTTAALWNAFFDSIDAVVRTLESGGFFRFSLFFCLRWLFVVVLLRVCLCFWFFVITFFSFRFSCSHEPRALARCRRK